MKLNLDDTEMGCIHSGTRRIQASVPEEKACYITRTGDAGFTVSGKIPLLLSDEGNSLGRCLLYDRRNHFIGESDIRVS